MASQHVTGLDQVLLLGDSLFQRSFSQEHGFGFGAALADAYVRKRDVVNRGFSGYNTANLLTILPHIAFPAPDVTRIRLVIVFIGANDAIVPGGHQHVPIDEYRRNLTKILTWPAIVAHKPRIVLISPPPVDEHLCSREDFARGHNAVQRKQQITRAYADAAMEVAEELAAGASSQLDIRFLHFWEQVMLSVGWAPGQPLIGSLDPQKNERLEKLLHDGLHLTPAGYKLLYDAVMQLLQSEWKGEEHPSNLPNVFPLWREMPPGRIGAVDLSSIR